MLIVAIRTFILYIVVLFAVRLMGKSELSKMAPFQLVIVFMIAELAAIPIDSTSASLINGVMAIFTLMFLQLMISYLSIKSEKFKNFVSGKPSILVDKGKLDLKELNRLRITSSDLFEQLRLCGYPSLSDVYYAVMESNGQLTVIPKASKKPLTLEDMNMNSTDKVLPMIIISNGILYEKNLYIIGSNKDIFLNLLKKADINDLNKVFMAFYDENKSFHVFINNDNAHPYAVEVEI